MDLMSNRYKIIVGLLLILGFGTLLLPVNSHAGRNILTNFSFDDCDPFEARAIVMDVFPNKQQLIAAEQTIYVVDMPIGDQRLITEITDPVRFYYFRFESIPAIYLMISEFIIK